MPNTTKAALEESLKRLLLKKPLGQDHDNRYYHRLWNKPHGFLLSFQGYL